MTPKLHHATRIFTLLAITYIAVTYMMSLSGVYVLRTINTISGINTYQSSLHEVHLATEETRKEYLDLNIPEFNAAMKDPYFQSADYLDGVKFNMDNNHKMLQEDQNILAEYKTQADRFVLAREAYKNLEKSFPEDTIPFMDEKMTRMVFLANAREIGCANDAIDPYLTIAKKYNFCSISTYPLP